MDVSVIVVNFNTAEFLRNCLNSIYKYTNDIYFEIIVVDNSSSDNSLSIIKNEFKEVKLVELEKNIGFGNANNEGVKIAKGKYLFFLNSDTVFLNNSVKLFYNFMELNNQKNNIGAIGGLLLDSSNNISHSSGSFPTLFDDLKIVLQSYWHKGIRKSEKQYFNENEKSFKVDYITGADLFMSKEIFIYLNGFDPDYFMYYEETDLQYKMDKMNLDRMIIDDVRIVHYEGSSFGDIPTKSNKRRIMYDLSHFIYFKKNKSFIIYYLFRILYAIIRLVIVFDRKYSKNEKTEYVKSLFNSIKPCNTHYPTLV